MPSIPILADLSAQIIPVRWYAHTDWYDSGGWYYHRVGDPALTHDVGRFFGSMDPDLRRLCLTLHSHCLATTPSCQGHHRDRAHFQCVWDLLSRHRQLIRTTGLPLRRCAVNTPFLFRKPDYELLWPSADAFCDEALSNQLQGYLGILVPADRPDTYEDLAQAALHAGLPHPRGGFVWERRFRLIHLYVHTDEPRAQSHLWRLVTQEIRRALGPAPTSARRAATCC